MDSDCSSPPAETTIVRRSSKVKANGAAPSSEVVKDDKESHFPVPQFWTDNFPKLSKNETFRELIDLTQIWWLTIESMLVFKFLLWLYSIILIFLIPINFVLYLYTLLILRPTIALIALLLKLLKIYVPLVNLLKKLLVQLDTVLDAMFVTIGKLLKYIKEKKTKMLEDLKKLWDQVVAYMKNAIISFVRGLKVVAQYVKEIYTLIFPITVREAVEKTIAKIIAIITSIYNFFDKIKTSFDEFIDMIRKTWDEPIPAPTPPPKVEATVRIQPSKKESSSKRSSASDLQSSPHTDKVELTTRKIEATKLSASHHDLSDHDASRDHMVHSTPLADPDSKIAKSKSTSKLDTSALSIKDKSTSGFGLSWFN